MKGSYATHRWSIKDHTHTFSLHQPIKEWRSTLLRSMTHQEAACYEPLVTLEEMVITETTFLVLHDNTYGSHEYITYGAVVEHWIR